MTCIGRRREKRRAAHAHNPRKGTLMEALHPDVSEVVLSEEDIKDIVARMGAEITEDYKDKNPLIVAVLKGAVVFTADIMRATQYSPASGSDPRRDVCAALIRL